VSNKKDAGLGALKPAGLVEHLEEGEIQQTPYEELD